MQKGFSTLLLVIIIGSVALGLILMLSTNSLWLVKSSIDSKRSVQSKELSNSCAEIALEAIRENHNYTGMGTVNISDNICNYEIINTGGNNRSITVSSTVGGVVRKLQISTDSFNPLNINSWQEVQ
jgi:hypothetical protein